jgi:hypothetical protein
MDRLLAKLERRIGRFAIPNLAYIVFGGMGLVFLLSFVRPQFEDYLALDWAQVMHGQVWRLVTFIFIPTRGGGPIFGDSPIWTIFAIYMFWLVTQNLEQQWGTFKLNVFYFMGMLGTILAGFITRAPLDGTWLNLSLFLAFATVFPDEQFLLFFIIPVKAKWLGILDGILLIAAFVMGGTGVKLAIASAFGNYIVFFAGFWLDWYKQRNVRVRQAARRAEHASSAPRTGGRTCAICGKSEDDGADIRVCSCEKCQAASGGKSRTLCLEHARNH